MRWFGPWSWGPRGVAKFRGGGFARGMRQLCLSGLVREVICPFSYFSGAEIAEMRPLFGQTESFKLNFSLFNIFYSFF